MKTVIIFVLEILFEATPVAIYSYQHSFLVVFNFIGSLSDALAWHVRAEQPIQSIHIYSTRLLEKCLIPQCAESAHPFLIVSFQMHQPLTPLTLPMDAQHAPALILMVSGVTLT